MQNAQIVVIGGGVIGLAHALTALEAGHRVTLLERDGRALGASVRNFGTLWPIGCTYGPERDQALFGVRRWRELAGIADFWLRPCGSLSLAHRDEAWDVLREFATGDAAADFELLEAEEVLQRFPTANPDGLQGGLWSADEAVVRPANALAALTAHVQRAGVQLHFGAPVVHVGEGEVTAADGRRFSFDRLVIAAGDDMRTLFPHELAAARLTRCRLQMMRTVTQPRGFDLGTTMVGDLTLCHYPAFRSCPSTSRLRERLDEELPAHRAHGVHVIAAQHDDGSLVLGDSHEYGEDFAPETRADIDELVLDALREFARVPDLRIRQSWSGVYLKSTAGVTQVVLNPREGVTIVTAMGGLGMTLSWGLAARVVASWNGAP